MPKKTKAGTVKGKEFGDLTVKQAMEKRVRSVHRRTTCEVIASLMVEGCGTVPVIDGKRKLVGIVSEHDLLAAIDDGRRLAALAAGEIMTGNPYSVRPETTLETLVHVLRASDLVRVPVVDAGGRLVGIITRRDVLRAHLSSGSTKRK